MKLLCKDLTVNVLSINMINNLNIMLSFDPCSQPNRPGREALTVVYFLQFHDRCILLFIVS